MVLNWYFPLSARSHRFTLAIELLPDTFSLEVFLILLEQTNEEPRASLQSIEAAKTRSKSHFDSHVHPHTFSKGDLVLIYDQANDKLGKGKFKSMRYDPYIIHYCL